MITGPGACSDCMVTGKHAKAPSRDRLDHRHLAATTGRRTESAVSDRTYMITK
jgi:hypothetical protein